MRARDSSRLLKIIAAVLTAAAVCALGAFAYLVFSTQAQGVIPVDKDGNVLYNNITWVDGRAEAQAQKIMRKVGGKKLFTLFAGTPIMGKDCIAKITWIKDERPDIYEKTDLILDVNG